MDGPTAGEGGQKTRVHTRGNRKGEKDLKKEKISSSRGSRNYRNWEGKDEERITDPMPGRAGGDPEKIKRRTEPENQPRLLNNYSTELLICGGGNGEKGGGHSDGETRKAGEKDYMYPFKLLEKKRENSIRQGRGERGDLVAKEKKRKEQEGRGEWTHTRNTAPHPVFVLREPGARLNKGKRET